MASLRKLGFLDPTKTVLFVCDIQEKFSKSIELFEMVVSNSERLVKASKLFGIPIVLTEQYPKGLGSTVASVKALLEPSKSLQVAKTQFSMMTLEVTNWLKSHPEIDTIIICGLETHVCVSSTIIQLLNENYNVHLVVDATSSRSLLDRQISIENLKLKGVHITTSEAVILNLLGTKDSPHFRDIQVLIKDLNPLNKSLVLPSSSL